MNTHTKSLTILTAFFLMTFGLVAPGCSTNRGEDDHELVTTVEDKFVGTWTGYETYTPTTVASPDKLSDLGMSITLEVHKNGTGSIENNFTNEPALSNLTFGPTRTGNGYLVYDANGEGVGALEWAAENDGMEWVVLMVPGDEIVCFAFYKDEPKSAHSDSGKTEQPVVEEGLVGNWTIYRYYTPGNMEYADRADFEMSLQINADGSGTWSRNQNGYNQNTSLTISYRQDDGIYIFGQAGGIVSLEHRPRGTIEKGPTITLDPPANIEASTIILTDLTQEENPVCYWLARSQ